MPGSIHSVFNDPFIFQSAIRAANVDLSIRATGTYRAELTRVDFSQLWMQRGSENLARVGYAANAPNRAPIFFLTDANQPSMHHSGMELSTDEIAVYSRSAAHHHRTNGPVRWGAMSLTPDDLAAVSYKISGRELAMPATTRRVRPKPDDLSRLRTLHEAAGRMAQATPDVIANDEVARAIENALLHAMIACLVDSDQIEMTSGCRGHLAIVSRLEEFLIANPDRPFYLAEVCSATGATERTLRVSCNEHLGMGPIHYLWLRRMHLVRRALLRSDPQTASVTDIAMNHGFWELGRFSVAYRRLFGEMPSASLRRSADESPKPGGNPLSLPDSEIA
jgi:AraC-like DNA-binding protein